MNVSAFPVHGPVRDLAHVSSAFGEHNGSETVGTVIAKFTGENLGADPSDPKSIASKQRPPAADRAASRSLGLEHLGLEHLGLEQLAFESRVPN